MTRSRIALRATLVSLLIGAGWVTGRPAAEGSPVTIVLADDLEVTSLENGLWLYRATVEMNGRPVESNGLVVAGGGAGSGGAIVIDTPWTDALTARLLDWAEAGFGRVAAVVATHFHADRLGGIAEVHRRGIASYGHAETARLAIAGGLEPPGATFESELILSTGGRSVELFFPGPGHSPDNVVAWLPESRLLFGGCLVKSSGAQGLGFLGDAVLERWSASLEELLARYPEARSVVPGHGAAGGPEAIRHTLELVREQADPEPAHREPDERARADGRAGA